MRAVSKGNAVHGELYREFGKPGTTDGRGIERGPQTVRDYSGSARYPFTILVDSEDVLSQRFGIDAIPTTFIVDKQGHLVYHHVGFNDWSSPTCVRKSAIFSTNE